VTRVWLVVQVHTWHTIVPGYMFSIITAQLSITKGVHV
jgi:hypothetical protein